MGNHKNPIKNSIKKVSFDLCWKFSFQGYLIFEKENFGTLPDRSDSNSKSFFKGIRSGVRCKIFATPFELEIFVLGLFNFFPGKIS